MKSLIIYHSYYKKHTEGLARFFAGKLNADLIDLNCTGEIDIDPYDLIGFGSGVYRESMSVQLIRNVNRLDLKNKDVFVYSTSGAGMSYYNKKLIHLLKSRGAKCRGSFACKGSFISRDFSDNRIFEHMSRFAEGHPNAKDLRKADKFIENVKHHVKK